MSISAKFRGILFCVLMFLSSLLGIVFMTGWMIPILFVKPALYRRLLDNGVGWWECFATSLFELLMGIKIVITGDRMRPGERSLIIMNHRTRLDWMYLWSLLLRESGVKTEKIILKAPLKNIPGAGWAMQCGAFIFINRKWEEDKTVLTDMISYFANLRHNTQMMIFPEGTDLTQRTKALSDEFARKNNVDAYEYVLHPRTLGFTFVADQMRKKDLLDAVYDVTVAYPYNFPQTEPQLIGGNFPREVHFHVRRHAATDLPPSENGLGDWVKNVWKEKEANLRQFYQDKQFSDERVLPDKCEEQAKMTLRIAFLYWTVFILAILILLVCSSLARWYFLILSIFFIFMGYRGGFELFQAQYCNRFFKGSDKSN